MDTHKLLAECPCASYLTTTNLIVLSIKWQYTIARMVAQSLRNYTHTHIKYTNQDLVRRRGSKNESNYGIYSKVFPGSTVVKKLPANSGDSKDTGLIPGLGRDPGEGNGNPLQYSCLENPMDRGAWQAAEHGVAKSRT